MNNTPQFSALQKDSEVSLLSLFKVVLKNRWIIIILTIAGFCFGILFGILSYTKVYLASSSILLQSSQKVTSQDYSKVYLDAIVQNTYNIIINSSTTVKNVILEEYTYEKNGQKLKTNLLEFYNTKDINALAGRISKNIQLIYERKTQVLTISCVAPNPDIAAQIINNIIKQINIFYNTQMTSDSARNLKFVNEQIKVAKESLDAARLKRALFEKRNKEITAILPSSDNKIQTAAHPLAILELQKLQEDAKAKEDLYNSLVKKSQDFGIQAEQNTPSVIVLQPAFPPQKPLPIKASKGGMTGAFLMLLVAIGIALLRNLAEIIPVKENIGRIIADELTADFKKLKNILIKK